MRWMIRKPKYIYNVFKWYTLMIKKDARHIILMTSHRYNVLSRDLDQPQECYSTPQLETL